MSSIIIKELYDADDIFGLVEKVNFNFDQLLAAGGGPAGPAGVQGPTGPAGVAGDRGSEWFAATGASGIINTPTDGQLRTNDFRLEDDGDVNIYNGTTWVQSGLNIEGPQGPIGPQGDGSISIIHSEVSPVGEVVPQVTPGGGKKTLYDHINALATNVNDEDDYDNGAAGYINAGLDYVALGYGNNSLVLGHYLSMFRDNGVFDSKFAGWPTQEWDVPMLIVAQNDYLDPKPGTATDTNQEYTNGMIIGLNMTQGDLAADYDALYSGAQYFGQYDSFTQLKTINRNFDFAIESPGHIELRALKSTNKFRLSAGYSRPELKSISSIKDWANILQTNSYTEITAGDNFSINDYGPQDPNINPGVAKQFMLGMGNISISSNSPVNYAGKLQDQINTTIFGRNENPNSADINSNEISIINDVVTEAESTLTKYNGRQRIKTDKLAQRDANNYKDAQLRLGQLRSTTTTAASAQNFFYLGQAFDAPIIGYSGVNFRIPTGANAMGGGTAAAHALIPSSASDLDFLGYNILDGFQPGANYNNIQTDKSLTRLGIFPGFLNQKRDASGALDPSDPNATDNLDYYLDEGHKKLPTGSLDLYGTVRIREYGLAEQKTGYVAVNAGHGIVKWETAQKIGNPTGSIIMVSEMAMSNFSFFTRVRKQVGARDWYQKGGSTASDSIASWTYEALAFGSTARPDFWTQAFPGKGSNDWDGYYICNGAILADSRDIFARGAFSTQEGLQAYGTNQPMPALTANNEYYEDYATYNGNYLMVGVNSGYVSNDYVAFKNKVIGAGIIMGNSFGFDGLSLLAPYDTDSQFRVVLPNYFGRFPKQVFPSSETVHFNNRDDDQPSDAQGLKKPVTTYYKLNSNGKYVLNGEKYPLHSGFYDGGFPYIRKETLPIHEHYTGTRRRVYGYQDFAFDTVDSGPDGTGAENFAPGWRGGGDNNSTGTTMFGTEQKDRPGYTGLTTPGMGISSGLDANNNNYFMSNDYLLDISSNWLDDHYPVNTYFRGRSQKFHDPVFKGSYFAINLRGLRNPNRGNTLIPDFDFVAGVPISGWRNAQGASSDLSWYSTKANLVNPQIYSQWYLTVLSSPGGSPIATITPTVGSEAEDEFVAIQRNENTMHPYTQYRKTNGNVDAGPLTDIYENIYTEPELYAI